MAAGHLVLAGWVFDVPALRSLAPGLPTCKPNAALAMILAGLALWGTSSERVGRAERATTIAATGLLVLLTAGTLFQHATGLDLGLDELLFRAPPGMQAPHPLRMAVATAAAFAALGLGLLLLAFGRVIASQAVALVPAATGILVLIVYLYGVRSIAALGPLSSVAGHAAAVLTVLAAGLFGARPGQGLTALLLDRGPGGLAARRMLPFALAVPTVTGWLILRTEGPGSGPLPGVVGPFRLLTVLVLGASVLWAAWALHRMDLAERAATGALAESEELFRGIAETLPHGLLLYHPDGTPEYVSRYFETYTGLTLEHLRRGAYADWVHAEDREGSRKAFERMLASGQLSEAEERLRRRDGVYSWNLVRGVGVRDGRGRVLRWVVTLTDVEKRKAAQLAIKRHAGLVERIHRELRRVTTAAAADLRAPLEAIAEDSGLLARRLHGRLPPEADEFAAFIREGAARMQALIEGLLAYGLSGDPAVVPTRVDTDAVLDGVLFDLDAAIAESGAAITREHLPPLLADPRELAQVFSNLLANALKYRRPGVPPEIHVSARVERNEVCVSVRDNGLGIDEQARERIFQLFHRLHGRHQYSGTGIGLSICKRIVERWGGRIWVEPSSCGGSTFCFSLHQEASGPTEEEPVARSSEPLQSSA